jgi:hypothetical protein
MIVFVAGAVLLCRCALPECQTQQLASEDVRESRKGRLRNSKGLAPHTCLTTRVS